MNLSDLLIQESIKALPDLVVALVTLFLGWLVGSRISTHWALIQKRKELDYETAQTFHKLYGEFFALWKLWNYYVHDTEEKSFPNADRWELLNRACMAEAGMESLFMRLASARKLSAKDIELLGKFRQAYQQLRETIKNNKPLKWGWSKHPDYLAFKDLGAQVAFLIHSGDYLSVKEGKEAARAIEGITDNKWEYEWSRQLDNS